MLTATTATSAAAMTVKRRLIRASSSGVCWRGGLERGLYRRSALDGDDDPLSAADVHAPAIDLDLQLPRLPVAIRRGRLDAQQIVGRGFPQDAIEREFG